MSTSGLAPLAPARGLGVRGQASSIDSRIALEEPCPMREDGHTLSQRENPPHPPAPAPLPRYSHVGVRGEPNLLRGPAESQTPQDFPSFVTETI